MILVLGRRIVIVVLRGTVTFTRGTPFPEEMPTLSLRKNPGFSKLHPRIPNPDLRCGFHC